MLRQGEVGRVARAATSGQRGVSLRQGCAEVILINISVYVFKCYLRMTVNSSIARSLNFLLRRASAIAKSAP